MQTKTSEVRAALAACMAWYAALGKDIRLLTERTEALWFQIDDLVCALQEAEQRGNAEETKCRLRDLLRCALILQAEVYSVHVRNSR